MPVANHTLDVEVDALALPDISKQAKTECISTAFLNPIWELHSFELLSSGDLSFRKVGVF